MNCCQHKQIFFFFLLGFSYKKYITRLEIDLCVREKKYFFHI